MQTGEFMTNLSVDPGSLKKQEMIFASSNKIIRYAGNPIFTAEKVPFPSHLAFNAGVEKFNGRYYMAYRYDTYKNNDRNQGLYDIGTGLAESEDGINWISHENPVNFYYRGKKITAVNDARFTVLENKLYMSCCFNTLYGERPALFEWKGGDDFEAVSIGVPNQRNMVLCPDKINGKYWRMERPISFEPTYAIWASYSPDLQYWGESELLLGVEDVPYATRKIGAAAPPLKTSAGYILFFHAVYKDPETLVIYPDGAKWDLRYTCGAALLDLNDPFKVTAITRKPLLVAEKNYETGDTVRFWRENVVFPCGAILENDNIKLYYGAGDYCVCLAEITLPDLLSEMTPYSRLNKTATVTFVDRWQGKCK
jgi:beta-1,4-mannooligosaccharide/beta-1,4-mannosyl-N-acetylglucosamine phosphorylase